MPLLGLEGIWSQGPLAFSLIYLGVGTAMFFTARLLRPDLERLNWFALAFACTFVAMVLIELLWPIFGLSIR